MTEARSDEMSADEVRELFVDAIDGELPPAERERFDAALAADAELRAEWDEMRDILSEAGQIGDADLAAGEGVDILGGVQSKLRRRSGGRFYRDRFASDVGHLGRMWPLLTAILMLVILGMAWFGLYFAQELGPG